MKPCARALASWQLVASAAWALCSTSRTALVPGMTAAHPCSQALRHCCCCLPCSCLHSAVAGLGTVQHLKNRSGEGQDRFSLLLTGILHPCWFQACQQSTSAACTPCSTSKVALGQRKLCLQHAYCCSLYPCLHCTLAAWAHCSVSNTASGQG